MHTVGKVANSPFWSVELGCLMQRRSWLVMGLACTVALTSSVNWAQDEKPKPKEKAKAKSSLPDYFGQLALSPQQQDEIRKVAEPFDAKLAELRAQMADLQRQLREQDAARTAACEAKLTDAQKTVLKERRDAAAKEAEARKKKTAKSSDGDSKK